MGEARTMVEKIVDYETGDVSFDGLAVLIADNADRAGDFRGDAEELASGSQGGARESGFRFSKCDKIFRIAVCSVMKAKW